MSNREIFIDKLRQLSKEEMLERYIALLNTEKLTDYVADLEAKLAESEEEIERLKSKEKKILLHTKKYWFERCCLLEDKSIRLELESRELKQQLEEKEKIEFTDTINFVETSEPDRVAEYIDELLEKLAEKDKELEKRQTTNDRLYKKNKKLENQIVESNIRFYKKGGIEQLEKVKEFFLEEHRDEEMDTDYLITKDAGAIADYLLDQIKQLKEIQK